ncbi:MAG: c-type cytochrome [Caulobacteraceae bacterium]
MKRNPTELGLAIAAVVGVGVLTFAAGYGLSRLTPPPARAKVFAPPPESAIPKSDFGRQVALGRAIFDDPGRYAHAFVGNDLKCSNCHLGEGRVADSAPLWGAYVAYPQYRAKNGHVNTFAERLQGCFRFSENGKAPPLGDPVLVALESYAYFLAKGAPTGVKLPGAGFPKLPKSASLDYSRGQDIYTANCALCHGFDGAGQAARGQVVFPPLWGPRSYNWGAGMAQINNAAGFIKANMPLGKGGSLTDQQAWDVATFVDSQPRPQDPRFTGDLAGTRRKFHDPTYSMYGKTANGVLLGGPEAPSDPPAPGAGQTRGPVQAKPAG